MSLDLVTTSPLAERLAAVEARLASLEGTGGDVDVTALAQRVVNAALTPIMRAIDHRLATGSAPAVPANAYRHEVFCALAREVRALKEASTPLRVVGSAEFKVVLDQRLRALTRYLEQEVIPLAVAPREQRPSGRPRISATRSRPRQPG